MESYSSIARWVRAGVVIIGLGLVDSASSQSSGGRYPWQEYNERIRASEMAAPLTSDLFGDQISLYDGSTEFVVTDIDLPGNNGLPVQLRRRLKVESKKQMEFFGGFGEWDLDVPYLYGVFTSTGRWTDSGNGATRRCSENWWPWVGRTYGLDEIWSGNYLHLPGAGDQVMMYIGDSGAPVPSQGGPYVWSTRDLNVFSCTAEQPISQGEGFVLHTPDGLRYTFDIAIEKRAGRVNKYGRYIGRSKMFLAASRVEDRFGNWVAWRYSGDKLVAIESNDGRRIEIGWEGAEIAVASANGRTWNYRYSSNTDNNYPYGKPRLASVQQPDGHSWRYRYTGTLSPTYVPLDVSMRNCPAMPAPIVNFHVEMDHPTGATGAFQFGLSRHKRSGTPANTCVADSNPNTFRPLFPDHFDVYSIKAKTITGAGLAPRRWSYEYRNVRPVQGTGPLPCESCRREKVVVVKQPDGSELKQTFGTLFGDDNGRLLRSETYGPGLLRRETSHYISNADRESQPFPDVYGFPWGVDDASIGIVRPLQETAIEQDGETYIRRVDAFDAFARPAQVSRANSLNYGRYDRTERTLYHDNLASWVLGQPRQVDELAPVPGRVLSRVDFDARDLPWRHYAFGRQVDERTYLGDGSLSTLRDPLGHTTTLSDWKRGFPQRIQYADGAEERAQIDDNGWIRQVTDRRGAVRGYGYDAMGRLTSLIQPRDDEQPWNNTQFLLEQVGSAEYGIGGGHWRHTVSTGNARKRTLLDALWQPLLVESWDAADRAGTLTQTVARFDVMGRKQFASQPSRSIDHVDAAGPGSRTSYDALGRIVLQEQDSELGPLTTRTTYLPGNRQQVFNPRGQVTTTTFMAWDTPEQNHPVTVELPEGTFVDIERDGLGKPTAIRRRNADSTSALPPSVRLRRASAALQAD